MKKTQNFIETRSKLRTVYSHKWRGVWSIISAVISITDLMSDCVLRVTFVWTSLLLWIRFTGRTCNFIVDITHDGVRFRWCCTWHWFRSWRLLPIPIGDELFLRWLHCTLLACICVLQNSFIQFMWYFWLCSILVWLQFCQIIHAMCAAYTPQTQL